MDLYKEWDTLNKTKFNNTLTQQQIMEAIINESALSLSVLKKRLKAKIYWIVLFITVPAVWMLFSLNDPELLMILTVPLLTNLFFLVPTVRNYRKIKLDDAATSSTLLAIKTNIAIIKRTLRAEMITGAFNMPVAVIVGLLLGNHIVGKSVQTVMHNPKMLLTGVICLVIMVPLALIAAAKMNESAFGKHLQQLQENATRLEGLS